MKIYIINCKKSILWFIFFAMVSFGGCIIAYFLQKEAQPTHSKQLPQNTNMTIGIDSGHGGIDSGAKYGNVCEKDVNLVFGEKLASELESLGFRVILTRTEDELLTPFCHFKYKGYPYKRDDLRRRISKIESAEACLLISIHTNWSTSKRQRGPMVFFHPKSTNAQIIASHIQTYFNQVQPYKKLPKPARYFLLNKSKIPAVIIELGFLSNYQDRILLQDNNYLEKLISAITDGLLETL